MFNKQAAKIKKEEKKRLKAIEDAKSPEQKEFEKMQVDGLKAAEEYATNAKLELLKMGYTYKPIIRHVDSRRPDIVAAQIVFTGITFAEYQKAMAELAERDNPQQEQPAAAEEKPAEQPAPEEQPAEESPQEEKAE